MMKYSKSSRTELNLWSYAITILEGENLWHISTIPRKMHKFTPTTQKSLTTWNHTLNGTIQSCFLLMNCLSPTLNRFLFGIYCLGCLSCLLRRARLLIRVHWNKSRWLLQKSLSRQERNQPKNSSNLWKSMLQNRNQPKSLLTSTLTKNNKHHENLTLHQENSPISLNRSSS